MSINQLSSLELLPQKTMEQFISSLNSEWNVFYKENRLLLITEFILEENDLSFLEKLKFETLFIEQYTDGRATEPLVLGAFVMNINYDGDTRPFFAIEDSHREQNPWRIYGYTYCNYNDEHITVESDNKIQDEFDVSMDESLLNKIFAKFSLLEKVETLYLELLREFEDRRNTFLNKLFTNSTIQKVQVDKNGKLVFTFANNETTSFNLDSYYHIKNQ